MKTLLISGILALVLCTEAGASLNSAATVRVERLAQQPAHRSMLQTSELSFGLGIHGPIGDHGYFNLYFSEPHYRYYRPYYYPTYPHRHYAPRPYYGHPYYRYYPWPHRHYYRPAPSRHPHGYPPGLRHAPRGHDKHERYRHDDYRRPGDYSREKWFRHD